MKNRNLVFLIILLLSKIFAEEIPLNALQKGEIRNWWFLGPIKKNTSDYRLLGKIEKDPLNYFNKELSNKLSKNMEYVSSSMKYGGQMIYQLYDKFSKDDVLYALSYIESKTEQDDVEIMLFNGGQTKIEIFLNL